MDVVGPQVLLGLFQQFGRLFLVVDQLLLLPVYFSLQVAQPPVQVVFSKGVWNLIVVLQRIL